MTAATVSLAKPLALSQLMRHIALSASGVILALGMLRAQPAQPGPQSPGTFRADVDLVEVDAIVTDASGAFVGDLTAADFEVLEDGVPQPIALFSLTQVPLDFGRPAGDDWPESDVKASQREFEGRLYVIVLDDLHTSFARSQLVRDAAGAFVNRYLGPDDRAAVVHVSGRDGVGQELTGSPRLLRAAIDRFQGRKLPAAGVEKLALHLREEAAADQKAGEAQPVRTVEGLQRGEATRDPYDAERALAARRTLDAVRQTTAWLGEIRNRRKALLLFSEGLDYDIFEPFNRTGDSLLADSRQTIANAQRANVSIYGIDPRGLNQFSDMIEVSRYSDYPQMPFGTFRGALRELLLSQESLITLSEQTGGLAIVNAGDLAGGLGRIVLDNSRYYLLGYYHQPAAGATARVRLDVRIKRPGLQVRSRREYSRRPVVAATVRAPGGSESRALAAAVGNPLAGGTLPVRVFAAPFRGAAKTPSVVVAIEVAGRGLTFVRDGDRLADTVEVSIVVVDQRGRVAGGDNQTLGLKLKPETHADVARHGLRFISRLDLPPSRYQIRVGVHESGRGASAMVPYDLEVPDFARSPFAVSGVVLTSSAADRYAPANEDPQLAAALPSPPHVTRRFTADTVLTSLIETYDDLGAGRREIVVQTTIRQAGSDRVVFSTTERQTIDGRAARSSTTATVPLTGVAPGRYVLEMRATASSGRTAARQVGFVVAER